MKNRERVIIYIPPEKYDELYTHLQPLMRMRDPSITERNLLVYVDDIDILFIVDEQDDEA